MANNIKGITVEIGGNTGPLDRALKDVNKTSRSLQSELREVNRQLKLDPTNTTLLTQRQRLLAESVANTRNKLETLKEAEQQAQVQFREGRISEEQYRALQREVIRTEQQLRGLESQASRSNSVLNGISETVGKVGDAAGKVGNKMMPVTAAIAGAGAAASKFSVDFEDAVAKTSTIADESEVSIGDLRKGILKLSDDTGIAATEIANNVYDAISAGQKTGDAVNFVKNSTKLAKAGFAEAGQSLDLLTTIMNSYGMKAEEVTKVSDILINTQNLGKVTVGELSSSMGKVIPTAKAYGINLEQVASGYAIMTAKGIKAAETTTYQASMFNELGKSGTKASDAVKKVSGKSFQDLIKSGKTVGDVLAMMNDYAKKNNLSLADLFGSAEAGKAALILSANAGKDFNEMLKSMNNTAGKTDEAFKKVSNTTGEKLKKSLNQFKNDAIKLGDSIAPIIQKISNLAGILAQKLSGLSKGQLDMIVKIGLIVAAIGPMAKLIQGITVIIGGVTSVIGTITGAIGLLTGSLTVATPAATALAGAFTFLTGPIGLAIAAIAGIGIAGYAAYKHLNKKCVPAVDLFANKVQTTAHQIKSANGTITTSYSQTTVKISESTKKAVGSYLELDKKASKSLMNLNANSTQFTTSAKNTVIKNFSDMVTKGSDKGKELNNKMVKEFSRLVQNTGTLTEANKKAIVSKYTSMVLDCNKLTSKQKVNTVNKFKEILKETTGITKQQKDNLVAQYNQMGQQINTGYDKHYQERTSKLQKFFSKNTTLTAQEQAQILAKEKSYNESMKASTNEYTQKINSIIERAANNHRKLSADELKDIKMYQDNMKENAVKTLSASEVESKVILERIKSYSTSITTEQASEVIKNAETQRVKSVDEANKQYIETKANIEEMRDKTGSITAEQAEKMITDAKQQRDETVKQANAQKDEVIKQVGEQNAEVIKNIDTSNGQIKTKWQVLKEDVSKKAHDTWASVKESFKTGGENIKKSTHETIEKVKGKWEEAKTNAKTWGSNVAESLKNGLDSKKESIKAKAGEIKDKIKSGFNGLTDDMKSIGEWAIEGLKKGIEFTRELKEKAGGVAKKVADAVRRKFDINSPSRVMAEIGKFVTEGLAVGIEENTHLAVKASENLANAVISTTNRIKESTFQDKLGHLLNWGSTEKEPYQDAVNFINKLNSEQLEHSKSVLDKEYKFRVENVKNDLKNVKESNAKKLELEKNRVNSQIAYYQKMQRNTKNKNTKNFYANKIDTLKQYLKQHESTIKATQDITIKKLEVSKNALEKYYAEAKELLKNRQDDLKEFMSSTSNFASNLKEALKQNIDEIQKKEEESIKENLNLNDKWKEHTLKNYEDVHKTRLENLDNEYKRFEKNINAQTKLLDEKLKKFDSEKADTDDSKKEKELKRILAMNYSKKKKAEAQKELNALIKSREERHYKEAIEQQKEALKEQLDNKKESVEESKKALDKQLQQDKETVEKIYNANKEMHDKQLDYTKKYYAEQKKEANLNARVQKMIIENNQEEIISLLKSTGKEYEITGATLADRFTNAFIDKLSVVKDAIADITSQLNSLDTNVSTSNIPRLGALGGYSTSNINTNTNVKNEYGSILHADKIVLNGHKDTQSFAEELEFYRQQAAKAKGGR
ncbi:putative phage tail tape measure protein, family, core region domain protein [Clostridium botulinum C str. Eklund]|nr:putative phage tail tape measure protein, family, core region domain protein [Clostridium botulinum C str. Eklund]NEZ50233.1 phage tail tape measure protein [Clostridium botulinum]